MANGSARLGLLLTGTGVVNYGAQKACGLNRDEAMWHLNQAIKLDPTIRQANVRRPGHGVASARCLRV